MTRDEIIEATRAFLRAEILHDEAAPLAPDEPLLSAGVITSFDLVSLTVFLEQRFAVKVPDSKVSRDFLDTLEQVAALVLSLRGSEVEPETVAAGRPQLDLLSRWLIPSFRRRPVLVVASIALACIALDHAVGTIVERNEASAGLDQPDHRRMNYTYQNYERALAHHDLSRTPKAPDEVRIVFQGDSGTFGTGLEAEDACPAVMGRLLAAKEPRVRVYNVSYFGQTFVKDAEMLEADLPFRPDLVVLSFCSIHLHRNLQQDWWLVPPTTIVYNRPLFLRFLRNTPGALEQPEIADLAAVLQKSEAAHLMGYLHGLERVSAFVRNQLLIQSQIHSWLALPTSLQPRTAAHEHCIDPKAMRFFRGKTTADVSTDTPYVLDQRSLALLDAIVDRARAAGTEVALFWEPEPTIRGAGTSPPSRIPWNRMGWETLEAAMKGFAERKNVPLVNCRDLLDQDEFLDSERHWTVEGNAKIGAVLAEKLAPLVSRLAEKRH